MIRDKAINQLGFVVVIEWADGRIDTEKYQLESGAIQATKRLNNIEGVSAFTYKLTLGEVIA